MRDQRLVVRLGVSLVIFVIYSVCLPRNVNAQDPPPGKPAVPSTETRLDEIEKKLTQLDSQFGLWNEVSSLREELEKRPLPRPQWVEGAPWIAFLLVGSAFAFVWLKLRSRELVLDLLKPPDDVVERVKALEDRSAKLIEKLCAMDSKTAVSVDLTKILKDLTLILPTGGGAVQAKPGPQNPGQKAP